MSRHRGWVAGLVSLCMVLVGSVACGPKEQQQTTPPPRDDPEPRDRPSGNVKKLMPAEMQSDVEQVFSSQKGDLERCYNDFVVATGDKKLRGTIIIAVTIGLTPTPSKVWFLRNDFKGHARLTECFLTKIRAWEFPTWGGEMDYSFRRLTLEEM
ncbi:MAG: hypothetical protein RBU30_19695 [Polyangia bacterium]|nr:hypothetical protein [Polyangia bacterium]